MREIEAEEHMAKELCLLSSYISLSLSLSLVAFVRMLHNCARFSRGSLHINKPRPMVNESGFRILSLSFFSSSHSRRPTSPFFPSLSRVHYEDAHVNYKLTNRPDGSIRILTLLFNLNRY